MKEDFDNDESVLKKVKRIVTSTLVFFIAFVLSSVLLQVMIGSLSKALGYIVKISYNTVSVQPKDYHYWSKLRVILVFGVPPTVCLLIGLIIMSNTITRKTEIDLVRYFRTWFMFCMINLFLAHLFISPIGLYANQIRTFYLTFAVVGSWMGFNTALMGAFAVGSIAASLIFGVYSRNEVLKFNYSSRGIRSSAGKFGSIIQLFLLPMALAFFPIAMLCNKENFFPTVFVFINFAIISGGMFTKSFFDDSIVRCGQVDVLDRWPVLELLIAGAIWGTIYLHFK